MVIYVDAINVIIQPDVDNVVRDRMESRNGVAAKKFLTHRGVRIYYGFINKGRVSDNHLLQKYCYVHCVHKNKQGQRL